VQVQLEVMDLEAQTDMPSVAEVQAEMPLPIDKSAHTEISNKEFKDAITQIKPATKEVATSMATTRMRTGGGYHVVDGPDDGSADTLRRTWTMGISPSPLDDSYARGQVSAEQMQNYSTGVYDPSKFGRKVSTVFRVLARHPAIEKESRQANVKDGRSQSPPTTRSSITTLPAIEIGGDHANAVRSNLLDQASSTGAQCKPRTDSVMDLSSTATSWAPESIPEHTSTGASWAPPLTSSTSPIASRPQSQDQAATLWKSDGHNPDRKSKSTGFQSDQWKDHWKTSGRNPVREANSTGSKWKSDGRSPDRSRSADRDISSHSRNHSNHSNRGRSRSPAKKHLPWSPSARVSLVGPDASKQLDVFDFVSQGHKVIFGKNDSYIENEDGKRVCQIHEKNGEYVIDFKFEDNTIGSPNACKNKAGRGRGRGRGAHITAGQRQRAREELFKLWTHPRS